MTRARRAWVLVVLLAVLTAVPVPASAAGSSTTGRVGLVSHIPAAVASTPIGSSTGPGTSADGRFVVFSSTATNLVTGQSDVNNVNDVFLYSRTTGAVTLVSHVAGSPTTTANSTSTSASISADGAYVTFRSNATNLVAGQIDAASNDDVFLFTRATGAVTLVSHTPASLTTVANSYSVAPVLSADGAFVAFLSNATNVVGGQIDNNATVDVFIYTRATGAVSLVSHIPASATTTAGGNSYTDPLAVSADGAYVAFQSSASNLVAGQVDPSGFNDVFLYARATGAVTLVSHTAASAVTAANSSSTGPSVSADGAYVAFSSGGTNLVGGQVGTNGGVYLYARASGAVALVSHTPGSTTTQGNAFSTSASISADGAFVVFVSSATNLVTGQTDTVAGSFDVFLYTRTTGTVTLVSHTPATTTTAANSGSGSATMSADGAFVAFRSAATNLVTGQSDTNTFEDLFLFTRATGVVTLVSHTPASPTTTPGGQSSTPSMSADGVFVAFRSGATNLVAGQSDANGADDVFVFRRTAEHAPPADFDADADTDVSLFRPSAGAWLIRDHPTVFLGATGDIPVACDYAGDGSTDAAVFRPAVGGWYVDGQSPVFFGLSGDVPVPGDYDGDGDCDVAVFRPSVGGWYVVGRPTVFFGFNGDIPIPADYDGDGVTDVAIFRPSVGGWYRSGGATSFFGLNGDVPVPGDYDGNGTTDIAVFRRSVGGWYVNGQSTRFLGVSTDLAQPGDYDGDGATDIAVFRPGSGAWYVADQPPVFHGAGGDLPVPLPAAIRMATP